MSGFNSKLVRLKVAFPHRYTRVYHSCFNSKLVRLKVKNIFATGDECIRFNSKLVRLKVYLDLALHCNTSKFQFQTGAIKRSNMPGVDTLVRMCFNSKLVRLKVE